MPAPPALQITSVDIVEDEITVQTSGDYVGSLTVELIGDQTVTLSQLNSARGYGVYTMHFNRDELSEGHFTTVRATWVDAVADHTYDFTVLGWYRHSQYNTPYENDCPTNPVHSRVALSGDCADTELYDRFRQKTWLNGSGYSIGWGTIGIFLSCNDVANPGILNGNGFHNIDRPRGAHGEVYPGTLAKDDHDSRIAYTDKILIVDDSQQKQFVKIVTDICPVCAGVQQLDNYTDDTRCQAIPDLGYFQTIRLPRQ
jgi:hypothetical protein